MSIFVKASIIKNMLQIIILKIVHVHLEIIYVHKYFELVKKTKSDIHVVYHDRQNWI